jgi:hypothetical protein
MSIKHLVNSADLSKADYEDIIKRFNYFLKNGISPDLCRGKILSTLFFQPSTRTMSAFQTGMMRMGGGNGGYDIWIREKRKVSPETQFWGVAYEHQIMNEVPMEEHDEKVDRIVTARGADIVKK